MRRKSSRVVDVSSCARRLSGSACSWVWMSTPCGTTMARRRRSARHWSGSKSRTMGSPPAPDPLRRTVGNAITPNVAAPAAGADIAPAEKGGNARRQFFETGAPRSAAASLIPSTRAESDEPRRIAPTDRRASSTEHGFLIGGGKESLKTGSGRG